MWRHLIYQLYFLYSMRGDFQLSSANVALNEPLNVPFNADLNEIATWRGLMSSLVLIAFIGAHCLHLCSLPSLVLIAFIGAHCLHWCSLPSLMLIAFIIVRTNEGMCTNQIFWVPFETVHKWNTHQWKPHEPRTWCIFFKPPLTSSYKMVRIYMVVCFLSHHWPNRTKWSKTTW